MVKLISDAKAVVTPTIVSSTCGFAGSGANCRDRVKTFFGNRGLLGEKNPAFVYISAVFVYSARAAQGLLMGRPAPFSQLNAPCGVSRAAAEASAFPACPAYSFSLPIKNRYLPAVLRFLPPLTCGYFFLPIKFWGYKRLNCGFTKSQASDLRKFFSPNRTPFGWANSIGSAEKGVA